MKKYLNPEMEVIEFEAEDVITTSLIDGGNINPDDGENFGS